ncbi:MAG: DUF4426 domain-containing protein [Vibrio sp.]
MSYLKQAKQFGFTLGLLLLPLIAQHARAEQFETIGQTQVHYSALNTSDLSSAMTQEYKIKRDGYTGLLNISVLDQSSTPQSPKPLTAQVTGSAKNLLGQTQRLNFREIKEGRAIYYLAEFKISNEETFQFDLNIDAGQSGQGQLNFQQKFYTQE